MKTRSLAFCLILIPCQALADLTLHVDSVADTLTLVGDGTADEFHQNFGAAGPAFGSTAGTPAVHAVATSLGTDGQADSVNRVVPFDTAGTLVGIMLGDSTDTTAETSISLTGLGTPAFNGTGLPDDLAAYCPTDCTFTAVGASTDTLTVTTMPVPEPSTIFFASIVGGLFILRRRRI